MFKNILIYAVVLLVTFALNALIFETQSYAAALEALGSEVFAMTSFFDWSLLKGGLGDEKYIAILQSIFGERTLVGFRENFALSLSLLKERLQLLTQSPVFLLALLATLSDAYLSRIKAGTGFGVFSPNRYSSALRCAFWAALLFPILLAMPLKSTFVAALWVLATLLGLLWIAVRHFHRFGR